MDKNLQYYIGKKVTLKKDPSYPDAFLQKVYDQEFINSGQWVNIPDMIGMSVDMTGKLCRTTNSRFMDLQLLDDNDDPIGGFRFPITSIFSINTIGETGTIRLYGGDFVPGNKTLDYDLNTVIDLDKLKGILQ